MADDRSYSREHHPHREGSPSTSTPPSHARYHQYSGDDSRRPPSRARPASMAASVTLPSIQDHRPAAGGYAMPPHNAPGYPGDPRYASPNAVNGYPPPSGSSQHPPAHGSYLPPLQPQPDSRPPPYPPHEQPPQRQSYYDDRRPPSYAEPYPPSDYYYPQGGQPPQAPGNGYPREQRGANPFTNDFSHVPPMSQAAPRQRTSIACKYCRKRKIRCSGYQSAPGGKCQNCSRMNQECVFQPVSSSTSTAFVPLSAVQGGVVPPGTQLFGAYGQPLTPNAGIPPPAHAGHHAPPQHLGAHSYPGPSVPPGYSHGNYYQPMHSPADSYSSYGDARMEEASQGAGTRRRRTPEEQEEGYRLPPPRVGVQEEDPRRRSPADASNHSSPSSTAYPTHPSNRYSPRNPTLPPPQAAGAPGYGGRSPGRAGTSSGGSTPARQGAAAPQQSASSVMSLSNLVDKNDFDKAMINRLNRPRDAGP